MDGKMRKGMEQKNLAKHHASKADGLARQLGKTIGIGSSSCGRSTTGRLN